MILPSFVTSNDCLRKRFDRELNELEKENEITEIQMSKGLINLQLSIFILGEQKILKIVLKEDYPFKGPTYFVDNIDVKRYIYEKNKEHPNIGKMMTEFTDLVNNWAPNKRLVDQVKWIETWSFDV